MSQLDLFNEALGLYRKHGWQLARVLLRRETLEALENQPDGAAVFEGVPMVEAAFDALWFRRASHAGREAWELRLIAANPYALFETFEMDEAEEDREDVRREMEARLREYCGRAS